VTLFQGECASAPAVSNYAGSGFDPIHPPYSINNRAKNAALNTVTIDMDCQHGVPNPNVPLSASLIEYVPSEAAKTNLRWCKLYLCFSD
jgi:hypothetical protein